MVPDPEGVVPNTRLLRNASAPLRQASSPLIRPVAMTPMAPPDPNSIAPCSPPSRPLRAASGGGLRPALTAAARGGAWDRGRGGETGPRSNRETVEQKQGTTRKEADHRKTA